MNKRNGYLDFIKGIAIFLVTWGHAIEFASVKGYDYLNNDVFIFIYSFHMPLFMLISGYLFYSNKPNTTFKSTIYKKTLQLIIPIISWGIIRFIIENYKLWYETATLNINIRSLFQIIKDMPTFLWFLWSLYLCTVVVAFIKYFINNSIWAYFIVFLLMLFIPDVGSFQFTKFMFPYFVLGYLYHKNIDIVSKYNRYIFTIPLVIFPCLLLFWSKDMYIYTTGMSIYKQENIIHKISIILYRYCTGLTGALFIIAAMKKVYERFPIKLLEFIGGYTFGIYIIQMVIFPTTIYHFFPVENILLFNFLITPLLAGLMIGFCILLSKAILKVGFLKLILLGGR